VTNPTEAANTARTFYSRLAGGDASKAVSLMSKDATWITVEAWENSIDDELELLSEFITRSMTERYNKGWSFTMNGRGPQEILEYVLNPLVKQGTQYIPSSTEFSEQNDRIVSLGSYKSGGGVRAAEDGKSAYAHVLTVRDGKISRLFQFFYSFSIPDAVLQ
jgi:ketosteroid isomerase-like protein